MLAEWEPQSCVQLTWPHKDTDWAPILPEIIAVYEELAHEIRKRELYFKSLNTYFVSFKIYQVEQMNV